MALAASISPSMIGLQLFFMVRSLLLFPLATFSRFGPGCKRSAANGLAPNHQARQGLVRRRN
jgi:hypothetical protein